jgi:hypothetical protein
MRLSGPDQLNPASLSDLLSSELGRIMRELAVSFRQARSVQAQFTEQAQRDQMDQMIRDVKARAATVCAHYAKICINFVLPSDGLSPSGPVRSDEWAGPTPDPYELDYAALGLLFAEALTRYDPRIHGEEVALHELREVLFEQTIIPALAKRPA